MGYVMGVGNDDGWRVDEMDGWLDGSQRTSKPTVQVTAQIWEMIAVRGDQRSAGRKCRCTHIDTIQLHGQP